MRWCHLPGERAEPSLRTRGPSDHCCGSQDPNIQVNHLHLVLRLLVQNEGAGVPGGCQGARGRRALHGGPFQGLAVLGSTWWTAAVHVPAREAALPEFEPQVETLNYSS